MAHRSPPNAGTRARPDWLVAQIRALALALLAAAWCTPPAAGAAPRHPAHAMTTTPSTTTPTPESITAITLERSCFGCPSPSVLVLLRDGTATLSISGSARRGTEASVSRGVITGGDFDALARLVVSSGFFALEGSYADPQLQDGAWATTSIEGAATPPKRVFRREDAAPPALRAVETAIENVQSRIAFKPERR